MDQLQVLVLLCLLLHQVVQLIDLVLQIIVDLVKVIDDLLMLLLLLQEFDVVFADHLLTVFFLAVENSLLLSFDFFDGGECFGV